MKGARVSVFGQLLAAIALLGSTPAQSTSLSFVPDTVVIEEGEKLIVELLVSDVPNTGTGLSYFRFDLIFDPTVIRILDPNTGWEAVSQPFEPLGSSAFCTFIRDTTPCPDPPWFLTSTGRSQVADYFPWIAGDALINIDNVNGRARIGYLTVEFGLPDPESVLPSGAGALALVEIKRIGPGSTSIVFQNVILEGTRYYHPTNLLVPLTASSIVPLATETTCLSFLDSQEPLFDCAAADIDSDGVLDPSDNCLLHSNNDQTDHDIDGVGDVCDLDDDNDGISDVLDNDPLTASNVCIGVNASVFSNIVDGHLTCASRISVTAAPLAEVLVTGNLDLLAPVLIFESGFSVAGSLAATSVDPCPNCIVGPTITVESPFDGSIVSESPLAVTGLIAPGVEAVSVNGVPALIGGGGYFADIPVVVGANTVTVIASDATGAIGTTSISVTYVP